LLAEPVRLTRGARPRRTARAAHRCVRRRQPAHHRRVTNRGGGVLNVSVTTTARWTTDGGHQILASYLVETLRGEGSMILPGAASTPPGAISPRRFPPEVAEGCDAERALLQTPSVEISTVIVFYTTPMGWPRIYMGSRSCLHRTELAPAPRNCPRNRGKLISPSITPADHQQSI